MKMSERSIGFMWVFLWVWGSGVRDSEFGLRTTAFRLTNNRITISESR